MRKNTNEMIYLTILIINIIGSLNGYTLKKGELTTNIFETYDQCDGPDSANYTTLNVMKTDIECSITSSSDFDDQYLVKDYSIVNIVRPIQRLKVNIGDATQVITVAVVMKGNLAGKFIMFKQFNLAQQLSKCVSTNNAFGKKLTINKVTILISDKLLPTLFLAADAWGEFKKGSTTICQGKQYSV